MALSGGEDVEKSQCRAAQGHIAHYFSIKHSILQLQLGSGGGGNRRCRDSGTIRNNARFPGEEQLFALLLFFCVGAHSKASRSLLPLLLFHHLHGPFCAC